MSRFQIQFTNMMLAVWHHQCNKNTITMTKDRIVHITQIACMLYNSLNLLLFCIFLEFLRKCMYTPIIVSRKNTQQVLRIIIVFQSDCNFVNEKQLLWQQKQHDSAWKCNEPVYKYTLYNTEQLAQIDKLLKEQAQIVFASVKLKKT